MLKATIQRSELARAVGCVSRTIQRKGMSPLAGTVKITAIKDEESEGLEFYGTDSFAFSGTGAAATIDSAGDRSDSVVINAVQLERILSVLPNGEVKLTQNAKSLTIEAGKAKRFRVPLLGLEYPREKEPAATNSAPLLSASVLAAFKRVEMCREGPAHAHLNGILLEEMNGHLTAYTFSGSRTARAQILIPDGEQLPTGWCCFVPEALLRSVHDLCEEDEEVTFTSDSSVFVTTSLSMAGCQLPMGTFPPREFPYQQDYTQACVVLTAQLEEALKAVSIGSSDPAVAVLFELTESGLLLKSLPSAKDLDEPTDATDEIEVLEKLGPLAPARPFLLAANLAREVLRGFGEKVTIGYTNDYARFDAIEDEKFKGALNSIIMFIVHT